jgi:multidrug efflux system membrane fusion protein
LGMVNPVEEFMTKKWVVIFITLAAATAISCGKSEESVTGTPTPILGVKVETVRLSPVQEEYEAVGTVRSKTVSVLSSKTVGSILAVHVREGDRVQTGQLLIEIDDRDTRAQLQKAQAGLREVGDAQEEIIQNIRAAESAREVAEAGRSLAAATFKRYRALLEEKSVSQQEFDEVQARLKIAEAEVDRAERMLQALTAKKNQLLAKMEQVKADITSAQVHVAYSRIQAPINGVVTTKQAEVGLLASPGVPLLTLEDDGTYRLEVSVEDSMLRKIHLGAPVRVSIDALGSQEFSSRVSEIVPASDPGSRSVIVKIDLRDGKGGPSGSPVLRSGLFGRARFPVGQTRIVKVPRMAVFQKGQLVEVYTVDAADVVRLRLIKTGRSYGDHWEVLSGLNDGDRIVVEGMERVKEGDRVQ